MTEQMFLNLARKISLSKCSKRSFCVMLVRFWFEFEVERNLKRKGINLVARCNSFVVQRRRELTSSLD